MMHSKITVFINKNDSSVNSLQSKQKMFVQIYFSYDQIQIKDLESVSYLIIKK